ncbi:hypothetical protein L1049_012704 [Liquidambar formosana]|uniref:Uncharacterized protein n=1 Tax=Liquidambar formosana TaxID=63359 RepID=A0AAP0RJ56_LIQFO
MTSNKNWFVANQPVFEKTLSEFGSWGPRPMLDMNGHMLDHVLSDRQCLSSSSLNRLGRS